MTIAGIRMTAVALTAAVTVFAASAPGLAGSTTNGSPSKQQGGGRTFPDYNIQKE